MLVPVVKNGVIVNRITVCSIICAFLLSGCVASLPTDKIDPAGNLSREDYLSLRERGKKDKDKTDWPDENADSWDYSKALPDSSVPPIPAIPAQIVKPKASDQENAEKDKLVSIAVTENVPLRDVLVELGREGKVNIEIDPRITGGVIFTAHEQPFHNVLKRLCALAGLRYLDDGDFIRVELDEPYQQTYRVDYLSLSRRTTSEIGIATNVFDVDVSENSNNGAGNSSTNNNSVSRLSGTAEASFWAELEKSLPQVLITSNRSKALVNPQDKASHNEEAQKPSFSMDKQAGLVTIFGSSIQQEAAASYLTKLQHKVSSQVLIEARIIEVQLDDAFQSGINWRSLFSGAANVAARFGTVGAAAPFSTSTTATDGLFTASLSGEDFSGIMSLVKTFGTTRVLSSPRLTVLNNQTAVLKVAKNEVYFITSAQFSTTTNAAGTTTSSTPVFSSTPRTVPVGLVMTVQPAIDDANGRVTMTLRPTISRVVSYAYDPSIGLNASQAGISDPVTSRIPVLAVREMDSVLQLRSGEVAVMGGLMQDSSINEDTGVPFVDTLPVVGPLTKSIEKEGSTSELVILLRATILDNPAPDNADAELYRRYSSDPRQLPIP